MPLKLKKQFIKEYGKNKGERIFYAWENKKREEERRERRLRKRRK